MPGYKTHLVGGVLMYGVTIYLLRSFCGSIFVAAEWLLFALIGSLFPDLDTKSKGQWWLYQVLIIVLVVLAIQRNFIIMVFLSIAAFMPILARHRGLFHRFTFIAGFTGVVALLVFIYAPAYLRIVMFDSIFFMVGAFSHLGLDFTCTALGIGVKS